MFQKRCCWFIFWAGCFHGGGAVLLLHPSSSSRWGNLSAWWAKSRWNPGEARVLWMIQGFAIRSPVLYAFIFLCVLFMCFLVQMIGLASVVESPAWLLAHRLFSSDASSSYVLYDNVWHLCWLLNGDHMPYWIFHTLRGEKEAREALVWLRGTSQVWQEI